MTTDTNPREVASGSFESARSGLKLHRSLKDKLRTGIKFFSRDRGPIGN